MMHFVRGMWLFECAGVEKRAEGSAGAAECVDDDDAHELRVCARVLGGVVEVTDAECEASIERGRGAIEDVALEEDVLGVDEHIHFEGDERAG